MYSDGAVSYINKLQREGDDLWKKPRAHENFDT